MKVWLRMPLRGDNLLFRRAIRLRWRRSLASSYERGVQLSPSYERLVFCRSTKLPAFGMRRLREATDLIVLPRSVGVRSGVSERNARWATRFAVRPRANL